MFAYHSKRIMREFRLCMWFGVAALALNGCASIAPKSPPTTEASTARLNRLTNANNGLEVLRWTVLDQAGRVRDNVLKYADGSAMDEPTQARLQRNGFRLVRIPAERIESLLADLGGATIESNEWQGQVHEWRSLLDRPVETAGRAVVVDGHVRRAERGEFRLLIRSWIVAMEDGPRMHFEMLPQHHRPQANNLRRLLGEQKQQQVDGFAAAALDLQLEPGYAYVLVGEAPLTEWAGHASTASTNSPSALPPRFSRTPRVGPSDVFASDGGTPVTLGELLLPLDRQPPTRGILVFVPRIAPELFISSPLTDEAVAARRPSE
jgi:hypothetical protein